jgi:enoyl-CoA hydratase/carnithine racemase
MTTWSTNDGVVTLTLEYGSCNEIGRTMLETLENFVDEMQHSSAQTIIIHSALNSGFCAGADLKELYEGMRDGLNEAKVAEIQDFIDAIHSVFNRLDMLPQTTIGVIHRVCFGGGLELALTCDVLIAEKTARFAFPELRLGIIPGFGGIPRLKRDIGNAMVRDILMTGRSINARRASAIGLVSQVVATGQGLDVARKMAKQMTKYDSEAQRACKAFIKPLPTDELEVEKAIFMRLIQRPVVIEALKTFYESTSVRPYLA